MSVLMCVQHCCAEAALNRPSALQGQNGSLGILRRGERQTEGSVLPVGFLNTHDEGDGGQLSLCPWRQEPACDFMRRVVYTQGGTSRVKSG